MIGQSISSLVVIHLVGIDQRGSFLVTFHLFSYILSFLFSWTAVRCQKYDETVEKVVETPDEPSAIVPSSSTDWCDDADAWNSDDNDDDGNQKVERTSSAVPTTVKKQSEVAMFNSMKINEEEEEEDPCGKSSSEDDEEDKQTETKSKSKTKNINVASADAFNEWKKTHLTQPTVDLSRDVSFPFYYIVIDDEEGVVNEAKLYEERKLRNKMKKFTHIDEDENNDETTRGGKE